MRLIFSTTIALLMSFSALAAHPGKVDFDELIDLRNADVIAQVNLSGWLMNMLQSAAETDRDAAILAGIDEITVRVLELGDNSRRYRNVASALHEELGDQGCRERGAGQADNNAGRAAHQAAALAEGKGEAGNHDGDDRH